MKKILLEILFLLTGFISYAQPGGSVGERYINAQINVRHFGAKADSRNFADGVTTASSTTFTSASAAFTSADVGKIIIVWGAGAAGIDLKTTIAAFTNSTTITLGAAAAANLTARTFFYGTNNTAFFRQCALSVATTGTRTLIPAGKYIIDGNINFPNPTYIYGDISSPWILGSDSIGISLLPYTQIINLSTTQYSFSLQSSNSFVKNVDFFYGGGVAPTAGGGVKANGSQTSFEDNSFINVFNGIAQTNSINWHGTGNTFKCVNYGMYIQNLTNADFGDYSLANNWFMGSGFVTGDHGGVAGIRIESSGGLRAYGNKFNSAPALQTGISINLVGAASSTSDFEIFNNSFENYTVAGIDAATSSSALAYAWTITGNQFYTATAAVKAIKMNGGAATSIWGGNISDNNQRFPGHSDTAIWLKNCSDLIVHHNVMFQGNVPIYVDATCLRITQDAANMKVATGDYILKAPTTFDLTVNAIQGMHVFATGNTTFGSALDYGSPLMLVGNGNVPTQLLIMNAANGTTASGQISLAANNGTATSLIQQRSTSFATFPEYLQIANQSGTNKIIDFVGTNFGFGGALFAPTATIDIFNSALTTNLFVRSGLNTGLAYVGTLNNSSNAVYFGISGSTASTFQGVVANYAFIRGTNGVGAFVIQNDAAAPIIFNINNGEVARMPSNRNFLIGSATDNSTGLVQITKTTAQLALHYDATNYTTFNAQSAGGITITPSSASGGVNIAGDLIIAGTNQRFVITGNHAGITTLSSGVATFTVTGAGSSSSILAMQQNATTSTLTVKYKGVCTTNSCTITATKADETTNTLDGSTVMYMVVN